MASKLLFAVIIAYFITTLDAAYVWPYVPDVSGSQNGDNTIDNLQQANNINKGTGNIDNKQKINSGIDSQRNIGGYDFIQPRYAVYYPGYGSPSVSDSQNGNNQIKNVQQANNVNEDGGNINNDQQINSNIQSRRNIGNAYPVWFP